jgi:uncharacterized repeat protein (TIGR03847 family)
MPRQFYFFDRPRRCVVGTVGQPGDRTFFLQVSDRGQVVSVVLEKEQVQRLAERLQEMLEEISARTGRALTESGALDTEALEQPIDEEFRVAALGLAWDAEDEAVIIEAQAPSEDPDEAESTLLEDVTEGPDALRVRLPARAAVAFVVRARRVVAAGRPPCPLCSLPLDPQGHLCPRLNGYRRAAEA